MGNNKEHSGFGSGNDATNDRSYRGDGPGFDDDEVMSGGGSHQRTGGTWAAHGADSGKIAPPREIMSDRNRPSDADSSNDSGGTRPS